MITDAKGLHLALEQLSQVYTTIASMQVEHRNATPVWRSILAEGFLDHARQLRCEIEQYAGIAALEEAQAELWLSVEGKGIGNGEGPASVLTALLDAFRKGVQSVAEFLTAGQLARRPTAALKAACDWRVVALRPGSLRIGVRLPELPQQLAFLPDSVGPDVRRALMEFLDVAAWAAAGEEPEALVERFPNPEKRRLLLNAVKPFAPRPRGSVARVAVSGGGIPVREIVLTRTTSQQIDRAIDRTAAAQVEDHIGDLREIDLDNLTIILRNAGEVQEVRCYLDDSLLETAKAALDRRVKVSGVRQTSTGRRILSALHVFRLEVLEEAGTEPEDELTNTSSK
jgi:hypothetical protein